MLLLEDRNVAVDFGSVTLCYALSDPDDVANLLLLQLDIGVEDAELELVHERVLHQLHLHSIHKKTLVGRKHFSPRPFSVKF